MQEEGSDVLFGGSGADELDGGAGNDVINGASGDDTLRGNTGDDRLQGGSGNDHYYVFASLGEESEPSVINFGNDVIIDFDAHDKLYFEEGINLNQLTFNRQNNDFLIDVVGSASSVLIKDQFDSPQITIDEIIVGDEAIVLEEVLQTREVITTPESSGHVYDQGDADELLLGQGGLDYFHAGQGNDILDGGSGNDVLSGNAGNDTYRWGVGDGNDRVYEEVGNGHDRLEFDNGIVLGDLTFSREGDHLSISLGDECVAVQNYFTDPDDSLVEEIVVGNELISVTQIESGVDLLMQSMGAIDGSGGEVSALAGEEEPVLLAEPQAA